MKRFALMACVVVAVTSCASQADVFGPIGSNLGSPLTLLVNSATGRLYVNNSNNLVAYNGGSLQVYSIATPAAPDLVATASTYSFSSQMYLDATNKFLYTPNRYNVTGIATNNQLLQINIDEASASFLGVTSINSDLNPFGIACCDPSSRMLAPTLSGTLDAYTTVSSGTPTLTSYNLSFTDSNGIVYTNPPVNQLTIIGSQAFVTVPSGGILVVNLDKLGSGANIVDYIITGVNAPRGIATDGTYLYVADVETISDATVPLLVILDPSTLTALSGNTAATSVSGATTPVFVAQLTMGNGVSTTDPEEVTVGTDYVFVTNSGEDSVTIVNRVAQTVNTTVSVGDQPFGMAIYSPGGTDSTLYVANIRANTISILDIPTLAVTATFTGP
ncbi:MAG: hypothetical protein COV45_01765 [Deltaproteobacteria bacterium CG11_big_fil_rev_8_21_14_0_20_47_16]|nr:MAG: hypothetical protein COV45_01765 [Deltaproteobacteria bacterium CG11_big_fil_rev_8_21_14_0_20_47_16]